MRSAILALFLCVTSIIADSGCTGAVAISGPAQVEAYKIVELVAGGEIEGKALIWDVFPEDVADVREMPGNKSVFFTGPPGTYKVKLRAITIKDGVGTVETARYTVTIGKPKTPPDDPGRPPTPPPGGKADPVAATAQLHVTGAMCTATVIAPRRSDGKWNILTAAHCVKGDTATLTLKDGRKFNLTLASRDTTADLAWFTTDASIESMPFAYLAASDPAKGTKIWHNGYGFDKPGNREDGVVIEGPYQSQIRFNLNVSSGDSGGGIFRADTGELVSAVCCTKGIAQKTDMWGGAVSVARKMLGGGTPRSEFNPENFR